MIFYVKNSDIDILKYDSCIAGAMNARSYAFSWYLNCVCDNWDVLILNDYEAVMPLPIRKKYGLHYIYQVPWVQQLGVFSINKTENLLILQFIKAIPKKYVLVDYLFNSGNVVEGKNIKHRTNYILPLHTDFENLKKSYNKNRKRVSLIFFDTLELNKNATSADFLQFYSAQSFDFENHKDAKEKLQKLLQVKNDSVKIWTVYYEGELIGGLIWLKGNKRITYLLPLATAEAKKMNMPTFLVNALISENQNTELILDFEGSMIQGVAQFYKSFGGVKEEYYWYKKMRI